MLIRIPLQSDMPGLLAAGSAGLSALGSSSYLIVGAELGVGVGALSWPGEKGKTHRRGSR